MPTMTLKFDPTDSDDVLVASQLIELIRDVNEFEGQQAASDDDEVETLMQVGREAWAKRAVEALWPRLGSKLRVFMIAAAELTKAQGEYTVPELADRLGERDRVVVSWRANLGRSTKAVAKQVPQAPPFFTHRHDSDADIYRYAMSPEIADAVLDASAAT